MKKHGEACREFDEECCRLQVAGVEAKAQFGTGTAGNGTSKEGEHEERQSCEKVEQAKVWMRVVRMEE